MKTSNNTVLISGGSAGIGLEIAKLLSEKGNKVIITGRNEARLQQAASQLKNVSTIVSDVSNAEDVDNLVSQIKSEFPDLNMVINNAGRALVYDITEENVNAFEKAEDEMLTNYLSIIRLNEKLLPILKTNDNPTIVNVSSVVAFVPGALATYSASKAALHSYTRYLRLALKNANVKVFELMPPLVDTEFSAPIGGKNGVPASFVAEQLIAGLEQDNYEIRVGQTEDIYRLYLSSPEDALLAMNQRRTQEVGE
ncbi:SDR family oxidoreductase [Epilithonimonas arachidiradicis]|uniref:Oxidoreductase n=1 Tax=Epilithonimonas arachidiradicis TaxID=1617282 RepID=A0A420DBJ0_9FLAO|nr:SDR family NAD(P)-dependent oxidoreductase [Epilithonimonas arachidiradicis]RKE88948.1 putative oxidoreductase [Epilithonimonas arachidiradicis]GGG53767.1 oxidoreductase [Epilithonimonas arachidiradicis]